MSYLMHAGLLLAACFLYYRFLLRSETYFWLNRWVLLACVILSFTLPLVTVPAQWSLRQSAEAPIQQLASRFGEKPSSTEEVARPIISEEVRSTTSTQPISGNEQTLNNSLSTTSLTTENTTETAPIAVASSQNSSTNWLRILFWIYVAGLLVFGLHFLLQVGALVGRMLRNPGYDLGDFRLVELEENVAPYSFWNRIFLNPAQYDEDTFHRIVEHEQIHINQKHSLDILLAELLIVVQWCNPFAWWYRAAIEHNLEFLTDAMMLRQGTDPVQYQLSLVQVASPNQPQGLTSNYNQSFLEKRITMMKTKHSSNRSAWKYLALLPLLVFSVLQLNAIDQQVAVTSEASVPAKPWVAKPNPTPVASTEVAVATPRPAPTPQPRPNVAASPAPTPTSDPNPIPVAEANSLRLSITTGPTDMSKATRSWTATIEGNEVCFQFLIKGNHYMSTHSQCIEKKELGQLPGAQMGEFSLTRYAGQMTFKGIFDAGTGLGTFTFNPSQKFVNLLQKEGYGTYKEEELIHFFYADFDADYLRYIKKEGYNPGRKQLLEIAIFFDNQEELEQRLSSFQKAGYDQPSLRQLIELQIHGVTNEYASDLAKLGFDDLSYRELVEAKIHGISTDFMSELKRAGFSDLSFAEAKEMAIHNISPEFVAELTSLGYDNLNPREVVEAKIHGVNSQEIAGLQRAGLTDITLDEARDLAIHGVTANYVYELAQLGYDDLTSRQVVDAKIHGVNSRQIAEIKALGYDNISLRQAKELAIHNVSNRYIREMRAFNLGTMSLSDLKDAKIHGVTPAFVERNRDKGDNLDDFIDMKIHGRY